MRIQLVNTQTYLNVAEVEKLVYRGEAAFIGDTRRQFRYLEAHEQKMLRADIAQARERLMDDARIENGRRVVFWNGDGDPAGRSVPGARRS